MQTCLEKRGIPARASALTRNDYNIHDQYSETHKDALSDGDPLGKGTGYGGHTHSVPDCNLNKENQYGPALVDTSLNVADGQIVV